MLADTYLSFRAFHCCNGHLCCGPSTRLLACTTKLYCMDTAEQLAQVGLDNLRVLRLAQYLEQIIVA